MKKCNNTYGFTLLEMLLVIAIISILASIVIVAINPARQLAQAGNAQRASDLSAIYKAAGQYYIDHLEWPANPIPTDLTEICDTGTTEGDHNTTTTVSDCDDAGLVDLTELVPEYLSAIPVDPLGPLALLFNVANAVTGGTGYYIALENPKKVVLASARSTAQNLPLVAIGTTTHPTGGNDGDGGDDEECVSSGIVATGGIETTDGCYKIHTFTSSGDLVVTSPGSPIEFLVVGAGGGGGERGGGGGGKVVFISGNVGSPQTLSFIVGTGGAGGTTGSDGGSSHFVGPDADGGKGGNDDSVVTNNGGNSGSGYIGGDLYTGCVGVLGGGGAGNSADGGDSSGATDQAGSGGAGTASSISGSSVTYGGGGGAGAYQGSCGNAVAGLGVDGGGNGQGDNGAPGTATDGVDGRGGGGGGGQSAQGDGGDGVVIVRYQP